MSTESSAITRQENISFINEMELKLRQKMSERSSFEVRRMISRNEGRNFLDLMTGDSNLSVEERSKIRSFVKRRLRGEPLEYILEKTSFMDFELNTPHGTFIPRPETGTLVEEAAECGRLLNRERLEILDLGTGSGNILIGICKRLQCAAGYGIDISNTALETAKKNIAEHGLSPRIVVSKMDYQSRDFAYDPKRYDMIVVNPPYVGRKEYLRLEMEVHHEPAEALIGGDSGVEMPKWILRRSRAKLKCDGFLVMEIGKGQDRILAEEVRRTGELSLVKTAADENSIPRVMVFRNKGKG